MRALERRGFTALHVVVATTGLAYLYMKHFMTTDDPFALVNHPLQGPTLAVHIVAAPVFVVFFGMILRSHTLRKIRIGRTTNRMSGWVSVVGFAVMTISGYLIQVSAAPVLTTIWFWTHVVSGCAFVVGYGSHFVIGWPIGQRSRRRARARRAG